jgi:hypothetical protein
VPLPNERLIELANIKSIIIIENIVIFIIMFSLLVGCQSQENKKNQLGNSSKNGFVDSMRTAMSKSDSSLKTIKNSFPDGDFDLDHYIFISGRYIRSFKLNSTDNSICANISFFKDDIGSSFSASDFIISKDTLAIICPLSEIGTLIFTGFFTKWNENGSTTRFSNSDIGFPDYLEGLVRIEKDGLIIFSEYHHFMHIGQETGE